MWCKSAIYSVNVADGSVDEVWPHSPEMPSVPWKHILQAPGEYFNKDV